jgi:hypothetical protein
MLKLNKTVLSCATVLLLFAGCKSNSPKGVAESYLKAFHNQDYEKAKEYATDDTRKLLDMFISLAALTPDSMKHKMKFEVTGEKVTGDSAYVTYRTEGSTKEQSLTLKKIDGDWKVAATKDTINELEGSEMIDTGATNTDSSEQAAEDTTQ